MGANMQVEAILEIQALKALYYEIVDNARSDRDRAAARLREILAEDVKADYGARGIMDGREAVIDFLLNVSTKPEWLWHAIHSPRVEVTGDTAVGYWTTNGQSKIKGSDAVNTATGRAKDDFRRTPQGWRFTMIRNIPEA